MYLLSDILICFVNIVLQLYKWKVLFFDLHSTA